jgi:hypothetical protein
MNRRETGVIWFCDRLFLAVIVFTTHISPHLRISSQVFISSFSRFPQKALLVVISPKLSGNALRWPAEHDVTGECTVQRIAAPSLAMYLPFVRNTAIQCHFFVDCHDFYSLQGELSAQRRSHKETERGCLAHHAV